MRKTLAVLLATSALTAGGCSVVRYLGYLTAPAPPQKTVPPECDALENKRIAIVVFATPETELDYQPAQLEIYDAVWAVLKRNVKGVTVVDPRRVLRYQAENPRWGARPPEKLCKVFHCDAVLLISLVEFSTREPGSIHLARGRITAEAGVYMPDRSAGGGPKGGRVWQSKTIRVVHPARSVVGMPAQDDRRVRMETEKVFAAELGKAFYKHKAPREP